MQAGGAPPTARCSRRPGEVTKPNKAAAYLGRPYALEQAEAHSEIAKWRCVTVSPSANCSQHHSILAASD